MAGTQEEALLYSLVWVCPGLTHKLAKLEQLFEADAP